MVSTVNGGGKGAKQDPANEAVLWEATARQKRWQLVGGSDGGGERASAGDRNDDLAVPW